MEITLPSHKTKIVCTIGPASRSGEVLCELLRNGMNVARLNFSHGTLDEHKEDIAAIRAAAAHMQKSVSILVDLPGPKIRIGTLETEPLEIEQGAHVTLTTDDIVGTSSAIPVSYGRLPESVSPGSMIYLNDGFIELRVIAVAERDVHCKVTVGGQLLSGKGLNLPGARLFVDPITDRDRQSMEFALGEGIDTFGISFVETADDVLRAKHFAKGKGVAIHTIAKIERREAVENIEEILAVTDGIMIARGDLGVEVPIEEVPSLQKELIRKANMLCRPVITATQMLESMVDKTRPTRAEVTDVANAIADGTDAVMLSEETAIGRYPAHTVAMMSRIAASFERHRAKLTQSSALQENLKNDLRDREITIPDAISLNVLEASAALHAPFILTPTSGGMTPRRIARLKPNSWILACNRDETICNFLLFSYGVYPIVQDTVGEGWYEHIIAVLKNSGLAKTGDSMIITGGTFSGEAGGTDSMGIIRL